MTKPTQPFGDGRDSKGRFTKGNSGGPGNPDTKNIGKRRSALFNAETMDDMIAVARQLVDLAKGGDVRAIKELFDRTLGRPLEADLLERMERLEERFAEESV